MASYQPIIDGIKSRLVAAGHAAVLAALLPQIFSQRDGNLVLLAVSSSHIFASGTLHLDVNAQCMKSLSRIYPFSALPTEVLSERRGQVLAVLKFYVIAWAEGEGGMGRG
jgi:hypothetical protein